MAERAEGPSRSSRTTSASDRKLARAKCPVCGQVKAVQPPRGGDGSADVFPRHGNGAGGQCPGSRDVVDRSEYVDVI